MTSNGKHANDIVILGAARTAQGKFLGALSGQTAADLGKVAFKAAVERSGINPADLAEVIVGNVVSAGTAQALPRQISIGAGLPDSVGGITVNKVCGSGMKAVMLAANGIKAGDGNAYLAGGVEAMSRAPYLNDSLRMGNKYGEVKLRDSLQTDGLWCSIVNWSMGNAADFIGRQLEITREEMDEFALRSHQLAGQATDSGAFKTEIAPVVIKGRKGDTVIEADEPIRRDTTLEALSALNQLRSRRRGDGGQRPRHERRAAALVVASRAYADAHGHAPIAVWLPTVRRRSIRSGFYAPVKAIPVALQRAAGRWTTSICSRSTSVRVAGAGRSARPEREGHPVRWKRSRERRRDRARPPARCQRRARARHADPCPQSARTQARRCGAMSRRREAVAMCVEVE